MEGLIARIRARQQMTSVIALAGGVLLLVLLYAVPVVRRVIDPPPAGASTTCGQQLHFYAEDVKNNFNGPAVDPQVDKAALELHARRCADPALVVEHGIVNQLPGFAELKGDEQITSKTRELRDNPDAWRDTVKQLEDKEKTAIAVSTEIMSGHYDTFYMIDGVTDVPLIRKDDPDREAFEVLRFTYADGSEVNYKLDCGFQPVGLFPNVPPVDQPPPPNQPPPTTPPRVTTTTTTQPELITICRPGVGIITIRRDQLQEGDTTHLSKCTPPTTAAAPPTTTAPPATTTTSGPEVTSPPGGHTGQTNPTTTSPPATSPPTTAPGGGVDSL